MFIISDIRDEKIIRDFGQEKIYKYLSKIILMSNKKMMQFSGYFD
jgi:hypothetical protein